MATEIKSVDACYKSVKLLTTTLSGHRFFLVVSDDGLNFYSDESSSGHLTGNPIKKSSDDVLKWIANERKLKPFKDRSQVKPRHSLR